MTTFELAVAVTASIFVLSALLLLAVVALKWASGVRSEAHELRRLGYLRLLSQHIASPGSTNELSLDQANDEAFIDAVIDVRNTLHGPTVDSLDGIIDKTGLAKRQASHLRSRFRLGRRLRAAVSLAEIGDPRTARLLLHHLNDPIPEIRVQSARGLARMRYTAAIDVILDRFYDETPWVQTRFAETLALFERDAVWPLTAFVRVHHKHPDVNGVSEIIRIIGVIGDSEVGPSLAELLYTTVDTEVKIAIIETLGIIGGPLSLRPLRRMIQSDDWRIRAKTARAFSEIGDPSINPILRQGLIDESWWMRRNSAAALGSLPGGIDYLYEALESSDKFARDAASEALADAGELVAARDRLESGQGTERDALLVGYVHEPDSVLT